MADAPDYDAATLVAFEAAIEALPPLTRLVFLLHRVDDVSYGAIARRLSIGILTVESGLADALYRLCCALDGDTAGRAMPEALADANTLLSRRHRRYCEDRLSALGVTPPIPWDDDDDDAVVMRAMLLSMPPAVLETFILSRVEHLTCAEIAKRIGTFRWRVRGRMRCGIRHVVQCPASFERWLHDS